MYRNEHEVYCQVIKLYGKIFKTYLNHSHIKKTCHAMGDIPNNLKCIS